MTLPIDFPPIYSRSVEDRIKRLVGRLLLLVGSHALVAAVAFVLGAYFF
jgi:hypothetical protein